VRCGSVILAVGMGTFAFDIWRFHDLIPLHESVAIALMLGATSLNPDLVVSRWLETDHLKMTGVLSYSIYLWQGVFLRPNWGVLGFFLVPIAAFASWYLIERPGRAFGRIIIRRLQPLFQGAS